MADRGTTMRQTEVFNQLTTEFEAALQQHSAIPARIHQRDAAVWPGNHDEIAHRLGWLDCTTQMQPELAQLLDFAKALGGQGFTDVLWCGMGGSSLFAEVLAGAFPQQPGGLRLQVLDSSCPVTVQRTADQLSRRKTLYVFASKSGGTLETRCHLDYFWQRVADPGCFAVVTDAGSELHRFATGNGFRRAFLNNPDIGGRYSALSHFGLLPAALLGVDPARLLQRAEALSASAGPTVDASDNPAFRLGVALAVAARRGRNKCTLFMPAGISRFGLWLEQLVAESTGKQGVGILPVNEPGPGAPECYGRDRLFVAIGKEVDLSPLQQAGHPTVVIDYRDAYDIGGEVFRWEFATAVAGAILHLDPFDQPDVEAAKKAAGTVLQAGLPEIPVVSAQQALRGISAPDYVAIQAYLDPASRQVAGLESLCLAIRDRLGVAATLGIGPRYLHSTGQFHKGGPAQGVMLQVVDDLGAKVDIPGKPYDFAALFQAQAAGDYQALLQRGMRVARVSLDDLLATRL
jgi:transaldolase/glucose-6-phosphate isomerase